MNSEWVVMSSILVLPAAMNDEQLISGKKEGMRMFPIKLQGTYEGGGVGSA